MPINLPEKKEDFTRLLTEVKSKLELKEYAQGMESVEKALSMYPDNQEALSLQTELARLMESEKQARIDGLLTEYKAKVAQENFIEADIFISKALDINPEDALLKAYKLENDKRLEEGKLKDNEYQELLAVADAHVKKKQFGLAIEKYRQAIETRPEDPYPQKAIEGIPLVNYLKEAQLLLDKKQYDNALKKANEAVKADKKYCEPYIFVGKIYAASGNDDKAEDNFSKALKLSEFHKEGLLGRARANVKRNKFPAALEDYNRFLFLEKENYFVMGERAHVLLQLKQFELAIADNSLVVKNVEDEKTKARAFSGSGFSYFHMEKHPEAISMFSEALEIEKNGEWYYHRGVSYTKTGKVNEGADDFQKAKELGFDLNTKSNSVGGFARQFYNEGLLLSQAGDHGNAIFKFTDAITIADTFANAYYERGMAYRNNKDTASAYQDFDKTIALQPNHYLCLFERGGLFFSQRDFSNAAGDFSNSGNIMKDFAPAHFFAAKAYFNLASYNEVVQSCDKALELKKKATLPFDTVYNLRGLSNQFLENNPVAIKDFDLAVSTNPDFAQAYYNRGISKYRLGKQKDAIKDFMLAYGKDPSYEIAFFMEGICYTELKKWKESLAGFQSVVGLNPQNIEAYQKLAGSYKNLKLYPQSLPNYEKVIELNPAALDEAGFLQEVFQVAWDAQNLEKALYYFTLKEKKVPASNELLFEKAGIYAFNGKTAETIAALELLKSAGGKSYFAMIKKSKYFGPIMKDKRFKEYLKANK